TIYVAWRYRESTRLLPLVLIGVLTGIALLTKEVSIFLVVTPLVFAIFRRSARLLARALVSLAVGIVVWLAFPAWSLTLGLGERFVDLKLTTFERLIGVLQLTGWNRPNVSFLDALIVSAPQYAASYALLLIGAAAFVWLFLRRTDQPGMFLAAWLATSFGFGAFTTVRGQLNEQFFTYLMPGAIIAVVLAADAVVTHAASGVWRRPWPRRLRRLAIALPIAAVTWIVVLGTTSWYGTYHAGTDDGIQRTSQFITGELQPCDFVNGGGEVARYAYNLPSERTSDFSSGPRALSRGVHYFLLRPKDVWARYGNMTPDFAEWIQTNGVLVASFESDTYWGSQIWHVPTGPYDPVADIQPIDDGFFVNTVGSACGGYEIRGTRIGDMVQAYRSYGGKRVVGRPRSQRWNVEDGRLQLFDAAVFKSVRDADGRLSTAPIDLITELMRRSPEMFAAHDLPEPNLDTPASWTAARARLMDDGIARAYLGVPLSIATSQDWTRARERWGDPISLPVRLADGTVRQAFDRVVWERRREKVDLTVIADAVIDSGMVPVSARRTSPVPRLETAREPTLRSDVGGLGATLVGAVLASVAMAGCAEAIDRTRSRRGSSQAVVSEIAPRWRAPGTR
ncbi:MAG TPA: hypothetical protein VEW95_02835, partial [Candidatus Limnocylindrales bacterium]|nr:hypothetical protein [Candidatus Limnocylindrales bacterium]